MALGQTDRAAGGGRARDGRAHHRQQQTRARTHMPHKQGAPNESGYQTPRQTAPCAAARLRKGLPESRARTPRHEACAPPNNEHTGVPTRARRCAPPQARARTWARAMPGEAARPRPTGKGNERAQRTSPGTSATSPHAHTPRHSSREHTTAARAQGKNPARSMQACMPRYSWGKAPTLHERALRARARDRHPTVHGHHPTTHQEPSATGVRPFPARARNGGALAGKGPRQGHASMHAQVLAGESASSSTGSAHACMHAWSRPRTGSGPTTIILQPTSPTACTRARKGAHPTTTHTHQPRATQLPPLSLPHSHTPPPPLSPAPTTCTPWPKRSRTHSTAALNATPDAPMLVPARWGQPGHGLSSSPRSTRARQVQQHSPCTPRVRPGELKVRHACAHGPLPPTPPPPRHPRPTPGSRDVYPALSPTQMTTPPTCAPHPMQHRTHTHGRHCAGQPNATPLA